MSSEKILLEETVPGGGMWSFVLRRHLTLRITDIQGGANVGLMAYHVTRRTAEIGIRMALGATRRQIAIPIVRETLLLAAIGVVIGTPLVFATTRLVRSSLFGVEPTDPLTLGGAAVLLLVVAVVAAWVPARRAARVDPMVALRCE